MEKVYYMASFNSNHINSMLTAWIITLFLLVLAIVFNKRKYATFLGYFILLSKIADIVIRVFLEKIKVDGVYSQAVDALPFHMCNILIILSGIYLITKNKYLYGIIVTWIFAPILVMFIPSNFTYITWYYPIVFYLTHTMIIMTAIYGFVYFKQRLSFKMYLVSVVVLLLAFTNAYFVNNKLKTNFFFTHDYVMPVISKYLSLKVYRIAYIIANIIGVTATYSLARKLRK
ncbi:TMEM164 family acyltransferase [Oceanivirga miroungae]|uniref:Uncharacterized protein n=1 Tax=Oceanivirga miroungae TaxID=1130046 RepID=A0A6I8M6V3_9FUSO|nr:YwaF family protein [Oceanivirga miroungae]VWL85207.1 hypothetical protein OMES3154_00490 [Oceanivirga miroungae]